MNISKRIALTIAVAIGMGLVSTFALAGTVLVGQFKDAEAAEVEASMQAVEAQLENDRDLLASSAGAFGQVMAALGTGTTDTVNLTAEEQAAQMALGVALFESHGVDDLYFLMPPILAQLMLANATQQPGAEDFDFDPSTGVFGMSIDDSGNFTNGDRDLAAALPARHFGDLLPLQRRSDLVAANGTLWLVGAVGLSIADLGAGVPAAPGDIASGPSGLALVVARRADEQYLQQLGAETGRDLHIESIALGHQSVPDEEVRLERTSWSRLTARIDLTDAADDPVAVLASPQERSTFQDAIGAMSFFFVATIIVAATVLVAAVLVTHRTVARPITRLDAQMADVRASGDLSLRVSHPTRWSPDEVGHLANQFDGLLGNLQERTEQLRQSNQDLQRFAGVVSHDLKSPLSTLTLNLKLLQDNAEKAGDQKEAERIARMQRGVHTMEERITGILEYSRAREAEVPLSPVDLAPLVEQVRIDLAADIERTKGRLTVEPLPTVLGDRVQLMQVFQNLVANALKFTNPGEAPAVRIWAAPSKTGWAVHVQDNGRGFDPKDIERLFKPFSRLENSSGVDGHGIGLATCARIMQRLGGRLNAEGVLGKGAKFTVLLKALPADGAAGTGSEPAVRPSTSPGSTP